MESMECLRDLYFIVDGSGNYYHINNNGNLAVSPSRATAEVFTFADANQRIGGGKKAHFYSVIPAEVDEESLNQDFEEILEENLNNVICISEQSRYQEQGRKLELVYDLEQVNWKEYLMHFSYVAGETGRYLEDLQKKLSEVDMQICDIMHLVELYELDDRESLETMELLRDCRERRRHIKDEINLVECFQRSIGSSANVAKAKDGIKQMEKLEDRKYKPRQLDNLFKGRVLKQKVVVEDLQPEEESFDMQEDTVMEYVRCETVLDGRQNDWAKMVNEQVTFFENAKQYMVNLKLDLRQIDNEIERIMAEIEDANYNVTQGYKVFKELKELRNRQKEIEKELNSVETIVSCFDCESMVEAYRYCADKISEAYGGGEAENE